MLQATSADIIKAYNNINLVQTQLQVLRKDCDQVFDESIWKNATHREVAGTMGSFFGPLITSY